MRVIMNDITKLFEELVHVEVFDTECLELLEKVMNLDNPMKFDDAFATEEQLIRLEGELDRFDNSIPQSLLLKKVIHGLRPNTTDSVLFI